MPARSARVELFRLVNEAGIPATETVAVWSEFWRLDKDAGRRELEFSEDELFIEDL